VELADEIPGVDADPGQLQQIVMNLVINGAEAIGSEGGSVWFERPLRMLTSPISMP